jgi:hypothetical protein
MDEQTAVAAHTLDSIVEQLDKFQQRATYGAVARLLGRPPRGLMQGRSRSQRDSWIVSGSDGMPTGYSPEQVAPGLKSRETILRSPENLLAWLENPD